MGAEDVIISFGGFAMVSFIVGSIVYFLVQRQRFRAQAGGDYQALAEEAVRGQRLALDEIKRLNETLKEIERLLREV